MSHALRLAPQLPRLAAASLLFASLAAGAASWHRVPGAPDVEIDLASVQQERTRLVAWLRWWGAAPLAPQAAGPRPHRSTVRMEFDCAGRTVRMLAANAYDGHGALLSMASVPGPVQALRGADLEWSYDALCEAARAAGRF